MSLTLSCICPINDIACSDVPALHLQKLQMNRLLFAITIPENLKEL